MKNNKLIWIIIAVIVLLSITQMRKEAGACTSSNCVDFGTSTGTMQMYYGTNVADSWEAFANDAWFQTKENEVNTAYIRTWLTAVHYATSTFPLRSDGSYTWTNVDKFVDAVLASGAKPLVLFAHGDRCGSPGDNSVQPFDFSQCSGHGTVPPSNFNAYGDYVANVTQHFVNRYGLSEVNTWYFEIMNEPYGFNNFNPDYYNLFNIAKPRIKAIAPNAKVGGAAYNGIPDAVAHADYDFIDKHLYPDNIGASCTATSVMNTLDTMYNTIVTSRQQGGVDIISGEYNIWTSSDCTNQLGFNFQNAWGVAALIKQTKAGARMENWFESICYGDGSHANEVWGLWTEQKVIRQAYYGRKLFTTYNTYNSTIYADNIDTSNFEVMAIQNAQGKYISAVNKKSTTQTLNLEVKNLAETQLTDVESSQVYPISGGVASISIPAYTTKVLFAGQGGPVCGNGDCESGETCANCPQDCCPTCPIDYNNFITAKNAFVYCT